MRILLVGDVMGSAGRSALAYYLPQLKQDLRIDVTIANGENAAHGCGITEKICAQFYAWGVDCITSGNHIWDQREIIDYIQHDPKLLRPANFPVDTPGQGLYIHTLADGRRIAIINLMTRLFMAPLDDPFHSIDAMLNHLTLGEHCQAIVVDIHGEATSEKMAFAHYLDGRVSAVIGTHTHVPTADAHLLPGKTAYMTDVGMTGDYDSVVGIRKDLSIQRFVSKMPSNHFAPAEQNKMLCGVLITSDDATGKATAIEPVRVGDILPQTMPTI